MSAPAGHGMLRMTAVLDSLSVLPRYCYGVSRRLASWPDASRVLDPAALRGSMVELRRGAGLLACQMSSESLLPLDCFDHIRGQLGARLGFFIPSLGLPFLLQFLELGQDGAGGWNTPNSCGEAGVRSGMLRSSASRPISRPGPGRRTCGSMTRRISRRCSIAPSQAFV